MLTIKIPPNFSREREYILSVVFTEFLGLEYRPVMEDRKDVQIGEDHGPKLVMADTFFAMPQEYWLHHGSLPKQPLETWILPDRLSLSIVVHKRIPVIYGERTKNGEWSERHEDQIVLGLDIFGSAFFMLARYEEVIKLDRDSHGRFPAKASLAYQEGFIDRPIINEYIEILWGCLKILWPNLARKKRSFSMRPTHDVDLAYSEATRSLASITRSFLGDIIKRQQPLLAVHNIKRGLRLWSGHVEEDPYNTFDWMMDVSESHGISSAFYFMTDRTAGSMDGNYSICHPLIKSLLRKIHARGHEVGIHLSYHSYQDSKQTKKEVSDLKILSEKEKIYQDKWGARQHFLRWETPTTFVNLEQAGLDYDSTLSFADCAGFRCGICYEYPAYDIKSRSILHLKERPLVAMECSILDDRYMGFGLGEKALGIFQTLKERCRLFNGSFVFLWHNSRLATQAEKIFYRSIF